MNAPGSGTQASAARTDRAPLSPVPPLPMRAPRTVLPAQACDTHIHVFGAESRYPLAMTRHYTPALCGLDRYWQLASMLGVTRAVVVQPSVYAFDNRALLDALRGDDARCRGVAVIGPDVDDTTLDAMHAAGVRGVRANLVNSNGLSAADALRLAPRLRARGWHLQLQVEIDAFTGLEDFIVRAALPVVVDHFGLPKSSDPARGEFPRLLACVKRGLCWVKMSGHYRFADTHVTPLARALAQCNPERLLWATDWPHPGLGSAPMPDDSRLVDDLAAWLPDEALRRQVLVDNPTKLYWSWQPT
ncbi:MAG: amidohydrolase family protein [Betaproteobacteria bacterium]